MMKKWIAILLVVMMLFTVAPVAAFAIEGENNNYCEYGLEYGEAGIVRKTDDFGKEIYVHGTPLNNNVFALVNAPAMDYTKTIGSVTFSNYIKHNEKTLRDANRESITVTQVYVGIGASMRSNVDNVEFLCNIGGTFNFMPGPLKGNGYDITSDLVTIKTNTPCHYNNILSSAGGELPIYRYLDYLSIRPYTNLGRNHDGTWQKGLTWVFEEHTKSTGTEGGAGWGYANDPNKYMKIYPIRVETPNGTEYYQVIVTNDTNFTGERASASAPQKPAEEVKPVEPQQPAVEQKPAEEQKPTQTFDVKFSDVKEGDWFYGPVMELAGMGLVGGTTKPVNGVGTYEPHKSMTRAEFATIIAGYLFPEEIKAYDGPYNSYWYSGIYGVAVDMGLIKTSEFSEAAMNEGTSRQEMALMLVRAMEAMGIDTSNMIDSASIPDFNQVDNYYKDYVRVVYEKGLVGGMDAKGTFAPDFIMNRAQAAAVLTKLVALAE